MPAPVTRTLTPRPRPRPRAHRCVRLRSPRSSACLSHENTAPQLPGLAGLAAKAAEAFSCQFPQLLEHDRVDLRDSVHAFLEVDVACPAVERILELAVVAELREPLAQLVRQSLVDREPFLSRRLAEERLMQAVEPAKLLERPLVVLDPELDDRVRELSVAAVLLDDQQCRRLLAAAVAAGGLGGVEAIE